MEPWKSQWLGEGKDSGSAEECGNVIWEDKNDQLEFETKFVHLIDSNKTKWYEVYI